MLEPARVIPDPDPADWMRAVASERDRAAFTRLFDQYAPKVKAFFLRGGLENAVAEELVQEVMLTVWRRAGTYDSAQGGVSTWIFAIARNRRIDHLRRTREPTAEAVEFSQGGDAEVATDRLVEARQQHRSLLAAITTLPMEQADVLRLAFFEHKSHSEIAEQSSLPLGTIKSRIRLAMRHLRRILEEER